MSAATRWLTAVRAVFSKDLRSELRTRYALNALIMFVVTTISIIVFAISGENVSKELLAGVLWVIVFFSTMSGMSRSFVSEEERATVMTLQLLTRPSVVFFGKLLFNALLLVSINFFSVLLFYILLTNFSVRSPDIFVATMILGTLGLASASTIIAAIIAKANTKGTLYPVLSFPILLPLLLTVISATKLSVEGALFTEALGEFQILISYIIVITTASYLLFDFVWKD